MRQLISCCIGHACYPKPTIERLDPLLHFVQRNTITYRSRTDQVRITTGLENVAIQLQPQVIELIRTLVVVGDRFCTCQLLCRVIDLHLDIVISLHLPISVAGGTASSALLIRRGQFLIQLAELIAAVALGVLGCCSECEQCNASRK